jgi:hypothetical protein
VPRNVIASSNVLVALMRHDDQHHCWLNAHLDAPPMPWRTCEAALSETFHLIGEQGVPKMKEMLGRGEVFDLSAVSLPPFAIELRTKISNLLREIAPE